MAMASSSLFRCLPGRVDFRDRSHISHFAAIRNHSDSPHGCMKSEESRPSAFNGIMQQYSCKGATQVPWFRFFTWKVCSLAEVHRKNLMLRINWEDRCHFWGKSSQSFQSDFPPFWIPFGSEKIVPLETCLQYPHDLCETNIIFWVLFRPWFGLIFPIGNPSELGNQQIQRPARWMKSPSIHGWPMKLISYFNDFP